MAIGRRLVRAGLVRHVAGAHNMEDAYLFYRFTDSISSKRGGKNGNGAGNGPSKQKRAALSSWHAPDAYAFGVILCECLTLRRPYAGQRIKEIWTRVLAGGRPRATAAERAAAPAGYAALMDELWAGDPVARPAFAAVRTRLARIAAAAGALDRPPADVQCSLAVEDVV